ncbi:MAG: sulfite reductase flavoprotein subunit alpha [Pseudomonadota bacterium]
MQNNQIPYIPADAPFSGDQRAWLGGFLAGLHSRKAMGLGEMAVAPGAQQVQAKPLDILFGTQTGNAEQLANEAADIAKTRGFQPRVNEMDAIEMSQLAAMENVIIVVSTYGEGEMPDNAHQFWEALSASTAPRMETLNYAVLALGDTSYDEFCQAGKVIDTRLEQLGAKRLGARIDCDVDFEDAASAWLMETVPTSDAATAANAPSEPVVAAKKEGFNRKNPYASNVIENRLLSGVNSAKEIRHFSFDLGESGLTYEAGDALGVMPINAPDLVEGWLTRLGAKADDTVAGHDMPLGELLAKRLEIMTPGREFIREMEKRAGHAELTHVVSNGDKEALEAFLWGKDALDLMNLNPGLALSADEVIGWLKPLQHRAYSISSCPVANPGEVHLTVAAVRWNAEGRAHKGVASTFLADMAPEGAEVGIFMSPNKSFRIPANDDVPMIMVGPGTGIAPFRAFLQARRERGATGTNWLFFGDQHIESDFIYRDELDEMKASGLLSRLDLAFSRDQKEKIYVQNRMEENGKDLYALLEEGGHVYVCGDATRMAKDVDAMLLKVVATHGGLSADDAEAYVNALKREKRYVRDVY